jgi:hypothetical protein
MPPRPSPRGGGNGGGSCAGGRETTSSLYGRAQPASPSRLSYASALSTMRGALQPADSSPVARTSSSPMRHAAAEEARLQGLERRILCARYPRCQLSQAAFVTSRAAAAVPARERLSAMEARLASAERAGGVASGGGDGVTPSCPAAAAVVPRSPAHARSASQVGSPRSSTASGGRHTHVVAAATVARHRHSPLDRHPRRGVASAPAAVRQAPRQPMSLRGKTSCGARLGTLVESPRPPSVQSIDSTWVHSCESSRGVCSAKSASAHESLNCRVLSEC